MKNKTICYVKWLDACMGIDDTPLQDIQRVELEEVGWLLHEDKDTIVVGMEHEIDSPRLWLCIPKVNVLEIRRVPWEKFRRIKGEKS